MNSRLGPDVHWHEGMLLMPQHFQEFGNALTRRLQDAALTRGPFGWGVLDLHLEILGQDLRMERCDIVMKDGTRVVVSGSSALRSNALVPQADFGEEFRLAPKGTPLEVWFGIPDAQTEISVVDELAGRYTLQTSVLRDENSDDPSTTTEIKVRYLRGKLFFGRQSRENFTTIKLAEIVQLANEPQPVFSSAFIPPLLDVTASAELRARLDQVSAKLRSVNEAVGGDVAARPFSMLLQAGGNPESLFKLNATNMLMPMIGLLSQSKGVHPLQTYVALGTLVGALAIFAPERRCPALPPYDHENLASCFDRMLAEATKLLKATWSRSWEATDFVPVEGHSRALRATRPKEWIGTSREQYIAVSADLPPREIESFVTSQLRLMGAADFLGDVRKQVIPCVRLAAPMRLPDRLPPPEGAFYFQVERLKTPAERLRVFDESEQVYIQMERDSPAKLKLVLYGIKEEKAT